MKVRYYDTNFPDPNLVSELTAMVDSGSLTAYEAAARFLTALRQMERDHQVYAKPVGSAARSRFGRPKPSPLPRPAIGMFRYAQGHRLYLSFIPRPTAPRGELRPLGVLAETEKSFAALDTAARRHVAITTADLP